MRSFLFNAILLVALLLVPTMADSSAVADDQQGAAIADKILEQVFLEESAAEQATAEGNRRGELKKLDCPAHGKCKLTMK